MCIRDSSIASDNYMVENPVWWTTDILVRPYGDGRIVMTHPVSYTHLRAHETVLDLVCRLLLEKKKNINFSASSLT